MQGVESQGANTPGRRPLLRVDDLLVDFERRTVRRGSEMLELTDRSFRLLEVLISHAPERVDKDRLIAEVWDDAVVSDDTLAQRVRLLRQSIGDNSQKPRYIAAVRGRGYRLIPRPREFRTAQSMRLPRAAWLAIVVAARATSASKGVVPLAINPKIFISATIPLIASIRAFTAAFCTLLWAAAFPALKIAANALK